MNQLADSVVELAQIGGLQEFFVNSVDVLPAVAPAAPNPPVVPPQYNNITSSNNVTLVVVNNDTTTVNQPGSDQDGSTDPMEFTIPSNLVVSMEPSPNVRPGMNVGDCNVLHDECDKLCVCISIVFHKMNSLIFLQL